MFVQGDIVIVVDLLDPQGRNPKNRPFVLVSPPEQIAVGEPFEVVAITTRLPDPLPTDHVPLPWHSQRHPRTGLDSPNAAVCSWLVQIEPSRAIKKIGHVPFRYLSQIALILETLREGAGD